MVTLSITRGICARPGPQGLLIAGLFLLVACASCGRAPEHPHDPPANVSRELASDSLAARRRFNGSLLEKRRYVEHFSRSLLLADEARRRHLDQDPVVQRHIRQVLVDRLIEQIREEITPASITDTEIAAYRAEHRELFEDPARARVGQVALPTAAAAEALRDQLARLPAAERQMQLRAAAARESLDPATRDRGGDLGYVHAGSTNVTAVVLTAALKLQAEGDLAVVGDAGRHLLLMKTGYLPARTRPEAEVREEIRLQIIAERRRRAVEDLVHRLAEKPPIQISDEELDKIAAPEGPAEET